MQALAHNLARWTARIALGQQLVTTKALRSRLFSLAGRITCKARRITLYLPKGWSWQDQVNSTLPLPA